MMYICTMNDATSIHFVTNCVVAFSFLTSAVLMALVRIPFAPMWKHLRQCKKYLSLIFLIVGLSCFKTVFFHLGSDARIVVTSTLITAGLQSLLFACTGITFVNPSWVKRRWLSLNILSVALYAVGMLLGLLVWQEWFWVTAVVACIVYFTLLISYQFSFYREYNRCVNNTDFLTDEYSESRYAWIKHFFMAVSTLGITAGIIPFMPTRVYDIWMLAAAAFYAYVVIQFVNYWGPTAHLVHKVYEARPFAATSATETLVAASQEEVADTMDFAQLEEALKQWITERGFVKNDLMSDEFAESLGVNITTLRAYFSKCHHTDFRQWRTQLRIEYACSILREHPDYSYDTISEVVGIGDRSNFTRNFKKIIGMTPREYAEQSKDNSV